MINLADSLPPRRYMLKKENVVIKGILVAGIVTTFLLSSAYAQNDPMYNFYNGLSNIVESNMSSPDTCVKEAENFIRQNIAPLLEMSNEGKRRAQMQNSNVDAMTDAEKQAMMEQAGEALAKSKGAEALDRFMKIMEDFSASNPEHADKIYAIIDGYSPKNSGD
jgi:hypothetical protein